MQVNGIELSELIDDKIDKFVPVVSGRVAHIDADFIAYQVAYKEDHTWDEMIHNLEVSIETQKNLCGAEYAVLHLTASASSKGGRYGAALLREYQATRKDKEKPAKLEDIRRFMRDEMHARYWKDREADDGMAQANMEAITKGQRLRSVICSADKDLRMVPGLHLDPKSLCIVDADSFGSIWLDDTGSSKKVLGWGTKFFWAQMLMGDTADNISGLPAVCPPVLNFFKPTTQTIQWHQKAEEGCKKSAEKLATRKPAKCGPVMAADLLANCHSDKECFRMVWNLYKLYGEKVGFVSYKGAPVTPKQAFISEGQLLWMQRNPGINDFINFLKTEVLCAG